LEIFLIQKLNNEDKADDLLSFESKTKFFKSVYPALLPTSDSRKSSLDFYNSLLKSMSLGLAQRELSYSNYGCLYRLDEMTD